jgi:hypothetical protein
MTRYLSCILLSLLLSITSFGSDPVIYVNQVAYDVSSPKMAVIRSATPLKQNNFLLIDSLGKSVFSANMMAVPGKNSWFPGEYFYRADFSSFNQPGHYKLSITAEDKTVYSAPFQIASQALARLTLPSILHYYNKQRANTAQEQEADKHVILFGSTETADVRGGWCDASGDISKYFSHLAYTNVMLPQQIPLVTWSMINAKENITSLLDELGSTAALEAEALWGADYLMRSLSPKGYFYMTVFSYFKPDPNARRIVGLLANSVTTSDYQCAFREGGGMAIAALARIARWKKNGAFTTDQYLEAAKTAFAHLLQNSTRYADDGKDNILDDYCALMAATELWTTTGETLYRDEARKRATSLCRRMSPQGYFIANDKGRPFWHAADAGLPVIALSRYLSKEEDKQLRAPVISTIRQFLDHLLKITDNTSNPFGYARQTFLYKEKLQDGFFIPHENESGWWWQGENARLASLATAALTGSRLVYANDKTKKDALTAFAYRQLSWVLGCNPYDMCFMYGFGKNNVPYMASLFGHGSEKGGISNGITGKDGAADGSGIDFKTSAEGNEWRWTEQWLPHAAWFLQALTEVASLRSQ